jgi:hypothetical protein
MMICHITDTRPVPADTPVRVHLGDGRPLVGLAQEFAWGPGLGDDGEGRIQAYELLVPAKQ